jgi:hypothetical protein
MECFKSLGYCKRKKLFSKNEYIIWSFCSHLSEQVIFEFTPECNPRAGRYIAIVSKEDFRVVSINVLNANSDVYLL